ncbi:MAG: efflux RND transporter permease subunit [Gemmatimonadota bacterium]|nr:MAG: efflux RND transporter permease subunit [Gemmatimonadota bacterium]
MKIIELSTKRPVTVAMFTLAVLLFGLVSLQRLRVNLLPELTYPTLTIRTEFEGAAPAEVENLVTKPVEESVGTVRNLLNMSSISRSGWSDVILEFQWGTDMANAALEVRQKLDILNLPREVRQPILLRFDPSNDPIVLVGLTGQAELSVLRIFAEEHMKKDLETVEGVAAVKVSGGLEEEIHIEVNEGKLAQLGFSIAQISQRLAQENVNLSGGSLREGTEEYLVRTLNQFKRVDEIDDVVIGQREGVKFYLKDVAAVSKSYKERDAITRINGQEAVEIAIYKEGDANTVAVARHVTRRLRSYTPQALGSMKLTTVSDQSRFIQRAVGEVRDSAIIGGLLAMIVLFFFLKNMRSTAIIGFAIPASVIATFLAMYFGKVTLNIMSLGGLALGVGMLVDNSIVVLESIDRYRKEGFGLFEAANKGASEVGTAVIASTLTTICVFFPIIFIKGVAGQLFRDQALTITFSLIVSLIIALTLIPMIASREHRGGAVVEKTTTVWLQRITRAHVSRRGSRSAWREKRLILRWLRTFIWALRFLITYVLRLAWEGVSGIGLWLWNHASILRWMGQTGKTYVDSYRWPLYFLLPFYLLLRFLMSIPGWFVRELYWVKTAEKRYTVKTRQKVWFRKHWRELVAQHGGRFVALRENGVVCSGEDRWEAKHRFLEQYPGEVRAICRVPTRAKREKVTRIKFSVLTAWKTILIPVRFLWCQVVRAFIPIIRIPWNILKPPFFIVRFAVTLIFSLIVFLFTNFFYTLVVVGKWVGKRLGAFLLAYAGLLIFFTLTGQGLKPQTYGLAVPLAIGLLLVLKILLSWFDRGFPVLAKAYPHFLGWALNNKGAVLASALIIFVVSLLAISFLGMELIPQFSQGEFTLAVDFPVGTPIDVSDVLLNRIEQAVRDDPRVEKIYSIVGTGNRMTADTEMEGENHGELKVVMKDPTDKKAEAHVKELMRRELTRVPDAEAEFLSPTYFTFKTPIEVEVTGFNIERLKESADRVVAALSTIEGLTDVQSNLEAGNPEVQIVFDRERVAALGLDIYEISRLVRNRIKGDIPSRFAIGERRIDILVRATEGNRATIDRIRNLTINPEAEVPVNLSSVADVRVDIGPSQIHRLGQQRTALVTANVVGRDLGSVSREAGERIRSVTLPPTFSASLAGQNEEMMVSFASLRFALLLAIFLVYLVMASQFESLLHPFVIMFSLPLALIGVVAALLLTGQTISVVVLIGVILLAGIVVNNAIVLIDYINRLRRRGIEKYEAVIQAGRVRLRPILMTTATTVLALLPMALGFGEGAEIRSPMAIAVIGGMLTSTILTLVVIPTLYTVMDRKQFVPVVESSSKGEKTSEV